MPLQNILITASINSLVSRSYDQRTYVASTNEQSFPIETATGSQAGSWPDFIQDTNYTTNLYVNITQSWSGSNIGPAGIIPFIHTTNEEFFNGEFSGSNYIVSNGNLTDEDCQELLSPTITPIPYIIPSIRLYTSSYIDNTYQGDQLPAFYNTAMLPPGTGKIFLYIRKDEYTLLPGVSYFSIEKIRIEKFDYNGIVIGNDQTLSLQELKQISWIDTTIGASGGKIILDILNITEKSNYFLYDVKFSFKLSNGTVASFWSDPALSMDTAPSFFVLEPYLISTFNNSDCDVLQNNATQSPTSQYRQQVLYDDGSSIPSNINQIIAGNAEPAEVNDYLFNASDSTRPRYSGVRSESPGINQSTTFGGYGTLPNVENRQTYFAHFDYLQDTSDELLDKSAAHILYLFDEEGNVQTPILNTPYYWNLIDNYVSNEKVNIIIEAEENNRITIDNIPIIRSGVIPRVILYSQTGSDPGVIDDIYFGEFSSNPPVIPDYFSKFTTIYPSQIFGSSQYVLNINSTSQPSNNIHLNTTPPNVNTLEIDTTSNATQINLSVNLSYISNRNPFILYPPFLNFNIIGYLEKSTDNGSTWTKIYTDTNILIKSDGYAYFGNYITTTATVKQTVWSIPLDIIPEQGDLYRFQLFNPESSWFLVSILPSTTITVNQFPQPTNASASLASDNYWYTGSNISSGTPKNKISSLQLATAYYENTPIYQRYNPDYNYSPSLPFLIKPFDQIRFEGDEQQTYIIFNADLEKLNIVGDIGSWTPGATPPWTVSNGVATSDGSGIGIVSSPALVDSLVQFEPYTLTFTVNNYTPPGGLTVVGSTGATLANFGITGNGTYSQVVTSSIGGDTSIFFRNNEFLLSTDYFIGDITSVSLTGGDTGSLILTLDRDIVDGTNVNSFMIRRFNPHPNYVVLDTPVIDGLGFLLPEYTTNALSSNFDKIIIEAKENGLY